MQRCGWVSQISSISTITIGNGACRKRTAKNFRDDLHGGSAGGFVMDYGTEETRKLPQCLSSVRSVRVAAMTDDDVERLVQDARIIRHRGKIRPLSTRLHGNGTKR